jgi:hypothetical protein
MASRLTARDPKELMQKALAPSDSGSHRFFDYCDTLGRSSRLDEPQQRIQPRLQARVQLRIF